MTSLSEAGPVAILIAQSQNVPAGVGCATASGTESFAFSLAGAGVGPTRQRVVCLTGADMRGVIYAIYEFSQAHPRRRPHVLVDRQAAGEAHVDRAARGFRPHLSQPRLQIPRILHQRRRPADRMGSAGEGRADGHFAQGLGHGVRDDSAPEGQHGGAGNVDLSRRRAGTCGH